MKINGNELRVGYVIYHNGRLWKTVKTEHVKPGKGGAYMQAELKDLQTGTKSNTRFRADETVERAHTEEGQYQFLFEENDALVFMHTTTYEQTTLPKALLGDGYVFLQENMEVSICTCDGKPIDIKLPKTVILDIVEADPVVKGQTASASFKPAILSNGKKIMVPPHIESGVRVVVNTEEGTYVERAK